MFTLSIIVVFSLWVISLFSFARWRLTRHPPGLRGLVDVSSDIFFQIYLKASGICFLGWVLAIRL